MKWISYTDIELADLQQTEDFLLEKINYYKANYPNSLEIYDMNTALRVILDLITDLCEDDDDEDECYETENFKDNEIGQMYIYMVDWNDGESAWGFVCARNENEAAEIIKNEYENNNKFSMEITIDKNEDIIGDATLELGCFEEIGCL